MNQLPRWYSCRKWTAFALTLLNLISVIAVFVLVIKVNQIFLEDNQKKDGDVTKAWEIIKTVLIVSAVVVVSVHLFGLFVILKEHFYLVMAFAIIMCVITVLCLIARFLIAPIFVGLFSVSISVTVFAFLFAYEIRRLQTIGMSNVVVMYPNNQTIHYPQPNNSQMVITQGMIMNSVPQTLPQGMPQFVPPVGHSMQMQSLEWPGTLPALPADMPPPYNDVETKVSPNYSMKV